MEIWTTAGDNDVMGGWFGSPPKRRVHEASSFSIPGIDTSDVAVAVRQPTCQSIKTNFSSSTFPSRLRVTSHQLYDGTRLHLGKVCLVNYYTLGEYIAPTLHCRLHITIPRSKRRSRLARLACRRHPRSRLGLLWFPQGPQRRSMLVLETQRDARSRRGSEARSSWWTMYSTATPSVRWCLWGRIPRAVTPGPVTAPRWQ